MRRACSEPWRSGVAVRGISEAAEPMCRLPSTVGAGYGRAPHGDGQRPVHAPESGSYGVVPRSGAGYSPKGRNSSSRHQG